MTTTKQAPTVCPTCGERDVILPEHFGHNSCSGPTESPKQAPRVWLNVGLPTNNGPSGIEHFDVIELTPEVKFAGEMLAELEFACKYFRSAFSAQSDCMHEPEYQMWQGFEKLLAKIKSQTKAETTEE